MERRIHRQDVWEKIAVAIFQVVDPLDPDRPLVPSFEVKAG
jgi:hypothetical protein